MNDIRYMLEEAAQDAGSSTVTTEAVYIKAARTGRRRAAVVAAAVAVGVLATGAVVGPAIGGDEKRSVAAPPASAGDAEQAEKIRELLPGDIESVRKVADGPMLRVYPLAKVPHAAVTGSGPLDGHYLVTEKRDGKNELRGVSIAFMDREAVARDTGGKGLPEDFCAVLASSAKAECVQRRVSDGRVSTSWKGGAEFRAGPAPWAFNRLGRLTLPDGGLLLVGEAGMTMGSQAEGKVGVYSPEAKSGTRVGTNGGYASYTPSEFETLMLRPELVP
ncbi:hypothetical protein ACWF94_30635 [Streptomyces sp. NPDC055078]